MTTSRGSGDIKVQLFGRAQVCLEGAEIALSPLQLMLIAVIFGHGVEGVARSTAIRLLWGRPSDQRARQRLRQLLCDVRARTERPILETHGDMLVAPESVGCDLRIVSDALAGGPLREAAAHLSRGFVETPFTTPEPFEEWRDQRSRSLMREIKGRALARWETASERGDWRTATDAAEALLEFDAEQAEVVERVVEARALAGDLRSAEEAFARFVAGLPPGSNVPPGLRATVDRVREASGIGQGRDSVFTSDGPFVGRRDALWIARAAMDSVSKGAFELVLFSGESGIGKTRVLDEVHKEALLRGFRCLRAQPVELERNIPLNPLLDALGEVDLAPHLDALGRPWSAVIESLLPHGMLDRPAEQPPPIRESSLSRRLLESFSLLLERLARETPTFLMIDDLQWADTTTVTALQFLQRRWSHGAFGVVATVRSELVHSESPVSKYLSGTAGLDVRHVGLSVLDRNESLELVDEISESRVGRGQAERLCEIAGCHPLYLTELTRELLAGRLALPEHPSDPVAIPTSLGQMLDARLEALDDSAMLIAGVLAVAGKPLRLPEISRLGELSLGETAAATEALTRERFVTSERDRVRIAHELFRSAVYRHLSGPRRALHHRAIAEALATDSDGDHAGELAVHYARAGEDELAAEHGWIAAKRALDAGAIAEAVHLFEIVAESEQDETRRADATAALANALHLSRDITRANPQLRLASEQLRSTGRPDAARRLDIKRIEGLAEVGAAPVGELVRRLQSIKSSAQGVGDWESVALALDVELHLRYRAGEVDGIDAVLDQMRRTAETESSEARLLSKAGLALGVLFGHPEEAMRSAREAVQLSEQQRGYRLRALMRLMVVLHAGGRLTAAQTVHVIDEARELARRSGDILESFAIESNVAVAFLDAGDLDRAELLMSQAHGMAPTGEMDFHRFIRANNQAEMALARHNFDGAREAFQLATDFLGPTTPAFVQDLVNAGLGYCALETGRLHEANSREDALCAPPPFWYFDPTLLVTFRARLLERRGKWQDAVNLIEAAADDIQDRLVLAWLKLRLLQARLVNKYGQGDLKLVEEALHKAEQLELPHRVAQFRGLANRAST